MDIKSQQINLTNEKQLKSSKPANQSSADFANELLEVKKEAAPIDKTPETENVPKKENTEVISTNNIDLVKNNIISKQNKETEKEYIIETLTTENKKTNKELIPDKEIKISNEIEEVIEPPKPELLEQTGKSIEIPTTSNSKKLVKPVIEKIKTGDEPEKVELPKNEKQFVEENHLNKAIESLNTIVKEFNQSDDKLDKSFKKDDDKTDNKEVINNDFNIQENKDLLPQMTPNMNFSGDGQPFSSFMNNDNTDKKQEKKLKATAQDLAEEAAILSTMAENIAIANKNQIKQPEVKTVTRQDGIKKVDTKTNITVETVVKYDSVIMNEADVEIFANLVENQEVNLKDLAPKAAEKSIEVSKTLADMLSKAMEKNQPVRIDFDNNISVIIRISRDGKITADFLPSSQVAEAYLKENLPLLRQKFDDSNIDYESLNQRERRDQSKENNRKKGRNNE